MLSGIEFLGLWEQLNNLNFNMVDFDQFNLEGSLYCEKKERYLQTAPFDTPVFSSRFALYTSPKYPFFVVSQISQ